MPRGKKQAVLSAPVIVIVGRPNVPATLTPKQSEQILHELNKNEYTTYTSMKNVNVVYIDEKTFFEDRVSPACDTLDVDVKQPKQKGGNEKKDEKKKTIIHWTDNEERTLLEKYKQHGEDWTKIAEFLPGRSALTISRRIKTVLKKYEDTTPAPVQAQNDEESQNDKPDDKGKQKIIEQEDEIIEAKGPPKRQIAPQKKRKVTLRMCTKCKVEEASFGSDKNLIQCTTCRICYHTSCHDPNLDHVQQQYRFNVWNCQDCKPCSTCNQNDEEMQLICDACDRSYHVHCLGLEQAPEETPWYCPYCDGTHDEPPQEAYTIENNTFFEDDSFVDEIEYLEETSVFIETDQRPSELLDGNLFFDEDSFLSFEVSGEIDLDDEFVQHLQAKWNAKQELLQNEDFVQEYVEKEGLYTPLELKKQEEAIQAYLSKCTTEEERTKERTTRELFLRGATRDLRTKVVRVKTFHMNVTNQEIRQALLVVNDEEEVIRKLMAKNSHLFLHSMRKKLAESQEDTPKPPPIEEESEEEDFDDSGDEEFSVQLVVNKKKPTVRAKTKEVAVSPPRVARVKKEKKRKHKVERLRLTDIEEQGPIDSSVDMTGWSEARRYAYEKRESKPNSYYYRFNAPGEKTKKGPFTEEEKELFLERLKEFDLTGGRPQWGIFSMTIPGRVGYTCSNFYRKLIEDGELEDDTYEKDENGRLLGKKTRVENKKKRANGQEVVHKSNPKKKRKTQAKEEESDDGDETGEDEANGEDDDSQSIRQALRGSRNPLAGFQDSITGEEISNPYISKLGHVLSYSTWLKTLATGKCPFTKQPLTINDLKRLTMENINDYWDIIKNKLEKVK
jgi:hypothetical protein